MKYLRRGFLLIVSLSFLTTVAFAQQKEAALTNQAVVKLARAGFKEKTIISIISARLPAFDLSPDRMIELKRNGVSEKIIVAMLARQEGAEFDHPIAERATQQDVDRHAEQVGREHRPQPRAGRGGLEQR